MLRHTTATLLARAKVHRSVAQKILRHADIETTLAIYTHFAGIEDMRAAVAKLDFGPLEERAPAPVVPLRKTATFATNLLPAAVSQTEATIFEFNGPSVGIGFDSPFGGLQLLKSNQSFLPGADYYGGFQIALPWPAASTGVAAYLFGGVGYVKPIPFNQYMGTLGFCDPGGSGFCSY
jgi:hypothetical protein